MLERTVSRRDFLRVSALVGAGTIAAACAGPAAPAAPTAPQDTAPVATQPTAAPAAATGPKEAPQLAALVQSGALPPVEERLPVDPMVITPWEKIGKYGGTWNSGLLGRADSPWISRTMGHNRLLRWSPDLTTQIPDVARAWEVSDDGQEFTFHLRRGMKWSDGSPCDADSFMFWYEHALLNKDLTPSIGATWRAGSDPVVVTKIDDATVRFAYTAPQGLFIALMAQNLPLLPEYMKQFHPTFNKDAVDKMVADLKFNDWMGLWGAKNAMEDNPDRPVLFPWRTTTPVGSGTQLVVERNPYYWKVDPEGNQLPYIDRLVYPIAESVDVLVLKGLNGEIDMMDRHIATPANKSIFFDNMDQGGYEFFGVKFAWESPCVIALNLSHKDPGKREVYNRKEFRVALSHAINRQEIIDTLYVGDGRPAQPSPLPESVHYHEQLENQYLEYDPALANQMLDDLGLQTGADGTRRRFDGQPLYIEVEVIAAFEPWAEIMEMVLQYWKAVGVDGAVKTIDRSLFYERKAAYDHDCQVWTGADGVAIVIDPRWYMPYSGESIFGFAWADWWNTNGARGEEPPEPAKRQQALFDEIRQTPDAEGQARLMKEILDIAAEQFWCIGTTRYYQGYGIVKKNFRNMPREDVWQWHISNAPAQTHPEQYFFE